MTELALAARQHLVGDGAQHSLRERVLAAVRRERVGADHQHLLAHQRREDGSSCSSAHVAERGGRGARERPAEHRHRLDQAALLAARASRAAPPAASRGSPARRARPAPRPAPVARRARPRRHGRRARGPSRSRTAARPRPARRSASAASSGEPVDQRRRAAGRIGPSSSGSSTRNVAPRRPAGHPSDRAASSGRASVRMKIGLDGRPARAGAR